MALAIYVNGKQLGSDAASIEMATPGSMGLSAITLNPIFRVLAAVSMAASAYHGYKRNNSVGWAIVWGLLGGIAPVITPAVAVAQGFGERKK